MPRKKHDDAGVTAVMDMPQEAASMTQEAASMTQEAASMTQEAASMTPPAESRGQDSIAEQRTVADIIRSFMRELSSHPDARILSQLRRPEEPTREESFLHIAPEKQEILDLRLRVLYRKG